MPIFAPRAGCSAEAAACHHQYCATLSSATVIIKVIGSIGVCWQTMHFIQQTPASPRVQGILSDMQARNPQLYLERQAAIAAQRARLADLRALHAAIGRELQREGVSSPNARRILDEANAQIAKWENDGLCSPIYIRLWRRILRNPVAGLMRVVDGDASSTDALLQNSPFGGVLREFKPSLTVVQ